MTLDQYVKNRTQLRSNQISKTITLLNEGATIPFISRYRKEYTGNLDEVAVLQIQDAVADFNEIEKRKAYILEVLLEKKVSADVVDKVKASFNLNQLEDLYLPYKTKRKTKAESARIAGLEGLAKIIMKQNNGDPLSSAQRFINKEYKSAILAIEGASYIIADWINENTIVREKMRESFLQHGVLTAKVIKSKKDEATKYRDFFDYNQRINNCPSYRLLAVLRGADEKMLRVKIEPNKEYALQWLNRFFVKSSNENSKIVEDAVKDSYKRLLQPALETETKNHYKALADDKSIRTFSSNLEKLLLAAPIGEKRVLAIDPGFKSGCKVVCLDEQGGLLHNCNIYPHPPQKEQSKASAKIFQLVQSYKIDVIAIGDGTAGRETEAFIKRVHFDRDLTVFIVREDGASIYSASKIARAEFPNYDVTVRGAVSIGRRLMDPLAELVKIDPKSLGVGQYQHDVDQQKLQKQLDQVVVSAVNKIGVNLNTASQYLLAYVSGLGPKLAENILAYRTEIGGFKSRNELKDVPRLGANAFQQCAGFLRIKGATNPLDDSAVHPENYKQLENALKRSDLSIKQVIGNKEAVQQLRNTQQKALKIALGEFTFEDILTELEKPGVDPREKARAFEFSSEIKKIDDLKIGMKLNGIVTNVTDFGAFVNIGLKENGLIHKTQLANEFVSDPTDFISINQHVNATVVSVDVERKRIGLSLKNG